MLQLNSKEKKEYRCYSYCTVFLVIVKHDFQGGKRPVTPLHRFVNSSIHLNRKTFQYLKKRL